MNIDRILANGNDKSAASTKSADTDTISDKLSREVELLKSMPGKAVAAASDKVENHKGSIAIEAAIGAGVGLAVAAVAKNPGLMGKEAAVVGRYVAENGKTIGATVMAADWGLRIGAPMVGTWRDKDALEKNKEILGKNVGEGVISYGAGIAGGAAGAWVGFKGVPAWKNTAPEFDLKPSIKLGESPRMVKNEAGYKTARETELKDDVVELYSKSFPVEELQPVDEVRELVQSGKILVHATRDDAGKLQAFSFVGKHDDTAYKFANLDYIATEEVARSHGIGSLHARRLSEAVKAENPEFKALTLEMESPAEKGIEAAELATRLRRAKFYDRLDAGNTNINYFISDFADPSYRGLAHWRAWVYKPEEFNAVKAAHLMLTDEAGMQLPRSASAVKDFERLNNFWEPHVGFRGAAAQSLPVTSFLNQYVIRDK